LRYRSWVVGRKLDQSLAIVNGLLGDHLVRTRNTLATDLAWMHEGTPLAMERAALARAIPAATSRVAIFAHGLMCTENVFAFPDGSDYGTLLARDLGITPLRIRYNSGRAIAENGAALAELCEALLEAYPVPIEEIVPVGFSMGGLVVRSACHAGKLANHRWISLVRRAIYLGTPHRGAPLERAGRMLVRVLRAVPDPYTRLIADISDLRSEGLRDLGGADLPPEQRDQLPPSGQLSLCDPRHPVPLLPEIRHYLVAGALAADPWLALWFGDALVPVSSATAGTCIDRASLVLLPEHVKIFSAYSHMRLARDPGVYEQIRKWCEVTS
jgi:triacylglycerol lipase